MKTENSKQLKHIRRVVLFFMVALVLSGITAFPLETELSILHRFTEGSPGPLSAFIDTVYEAVKSSNAQYPFLAYGTDWLAFAHLVIAVAFIGPYKDPIQNIWVIEFGMISCLMIFPLALICGAIRGIPVYWQLIDCSFGVFGLIPLLYIHSMILKLKNSNLNTQHDEKK